MTSSKKGGGERDMFVKRGELVARRNYEQICKTDHKAIYDEMTYLNVKLITT